MPPVPLALDAVTATRDQEAAPSTRSPMPLQPGDSSAEAPPLVPSQAARCGSAASPSAARAERAGSARLETLGGRPRRLLGLLRRALRTGRSYYDPLFERPELIEDDYCRFRNQPCGW